MGRSDSHRRVSIADETRRSDRLLLSFSENDNKPEFKKSSIELKFRENIFGDYKIPFDGARDLDEGPNGKIRYVLDCSSKRKIDFDRNARSSIDCAPLFELQILSQSVSSQFDQLALKFTSSMPNKHLDDEYHLVLYALDHGERAKRWTNSMNIKVKIERNWEKPEFVRLEYEFVIKIESFLRQGRVLGRVHARLNHRREKIVYKLINRTNFIDIGSSSGEIFISDETFLKENPVFPQIELFVKASYANRQRQWSEDLTSVSKVKILFRSLHHLKNISLDFQLQSTSIQQVNASNIFFIDETISSNETLFHLSVQSIHYPFDKLLLSLENTRSVFSLIPSSPSSSSSSSSLFNHFVLKTRHLLASKSIYEVVIRVEHDLTDQVLSTLTLRLIAIDRRDALTSPSSTSSISSSPNLCLKNSTYFLYDFDQKNLLAQLKIMESNFDVSTFSSYSIPTNQSELIVDRCRMFVEQIELFTFDRTSRFQLCSVDRICFNISSIDQQPSTLFAIRNRMDSISRSLLSIRPVETAILALSLVFFTAAITLICIICRLKGFHLCLRVKNYLFYGKKYGLSNAQRLSSSKMAVSFLVVALFACERLSSLFFVLATSSFDCRSRISIAFVPANQIQ